MGTKIFGRADIKVIGIGAGASDTLNTMENEGFLGAETVSLDVRPLPSESRAGTRLRLESSDVWAHLSPGFNYEFRENTGEDSTDEIREYLENSDLVFVITCIEDNIDSEVASVVARISKEIGALTVGVISTRSCCKGRIITNKNKNLFDNLRKYSDTIFALSIDSTIPTKHEMKAHTDSLKRADNAQVQIVKSIVSMINLPGYLNPSLENIWLFMKGNDYTFMGDGISAGINRARDAADKAIKDLSWQQHINLVNVKNILINILVSTNIFDDLSELNVITERIFQETPCVDDVILGVIFDDAMGGSLQVNIFVKQAYIER